MDESPEVQEFADVHKHLLDHSELVDNARFSETDCSSDTQVLSDVHVHLQGHTVQINHTEFSETRFSFKPPWMFLSCGQGEGDDGDAASTDIAEELTRTTEAADEAHGAYKTDEDGDLIVNRKKGDRDRTEQIITIVHAMGTDLSLVGQQVWLGALLLCDFLLHYSSLLEKKVVIDLGAGVGLTSIVAAFQAATVFCTDRGDKILNLARLNVERNSCLHQGADIRVRSLDWTADTPLAVCPDAADSAQTFGLSQEDMETFYSCSIILAAEVVYDLDLTDAFFRLLYSLLVKPPAKSVYMTVEKRQVFTTADRDVVSPAYEHFRENLQDLCSVDAGPVRFVCARVDLGFPQYFHYQRTKELELWKIEAVFVSQCKASLS